MKEKTRSFGYGISQTMKLDVFFNTIMGLLIAAELFAIGVLSYLGTFSRYISDDYCEAVITRGGVVLPVVLNIYVGGTFRGTNRFTKFLFIALAEKLGGYNVQILPVLMIFVWLVGTAWTVNQVRKLVGMRLPVIFDYFAAVSIIFFSAWQAPNYFQTFIWRSGMATHFAPLVFMSLVSGFILSQINKARKPAWWMSFFIFLVSFLVGGFSEPPAAFMIVLIILLIPIARRWDDALKRRSALNLLVAGLAGAFLALFAMFFAPGNLLHGTASLSVLLMTFGESIKYTLDFLVDSIKTLPLPSAISFLIPFLVSFSFLMRLESGSLAPQHQRQIWIWVILIPFIQYLLIGASFAPSAYGQSYPAERARFLGRFIMTATLMLEGALFGILFAQYKPLLSRYRILFPLASIALLVLAFYPLRAGLTLLANVPDYRQWAAKWDVRGIEIFEAIEMGEQDLVVRLLSSRDGVKEIDGDIRHWVNRCAAKYYEVDTIRSVPIDD